MTAIYLIARCENRKCAEEGLLKNEMGICIDTHILVFKDIDGNLHDLTGDKARIEDIQKLMAISIDTLKNEKGIFKQ